MMAIKENDNISLIKEKKLNMQKRIIQLEKYNYNQKEFTSNEMVAKIKKIIEQEISRNDN